MIADKINLKKNYRHQVFRKDYLVPLKFNHIFTGKLPHRGLVTSQPYPFT